MEISTDTMRADLILRGYVRFDWGKITIAQVEASDDYGKYYRVISHSDNPATNYAGYIRTPDCTVTWHRFIPNHERWRTVIEWDEKKAVEQDIYLPTLYRFFIELEQCQHLSVVSPDGKLRSSPIRCMNCGKQVY